MLNMFRAVCRSKHVEHSINFGLINSITKFHLVGISTETCRKLSWRSYSVLLLPMPAPTHHISDISRLVSLNPTFFGSVTTYTNFPVPCPYVVNTAITLWDLRLSDSENDYYCSGCDAVRHSAWYRDSREAWNISSEDGDSTSPKSWHMYTKLRDVILQKVIILLFYQTHWKLLMFMVSEILSLIWRHCCYTCDMTRAQPPRSAVSAATCSVGQAFGVLV